MKRSIATWLLLLGCVTGITLPDAARAGIREGTAPNQEEAIQLAQAFLQAVDEERIDLIRPMLGRAATDDVMRRNNLSDTEQALVLVEGQIQEIHRKLRGRSISRRVLINAWFSNALPSYPRPGLFLVIRFRSAYAVGSINEDVTLELEQGQWRIFSFWFSPAEY